MTRTQSVRQGTQTHSVNLLFNPQLQSIQPEMLLRVITGKSWQHRRVSGQ